jgi:hypothetical protein
MENEKAEEKNSKKREICDDKITYYLEQTRIVRGDA